MTNEKLLTERVNELQNELTEVKSVSSEFRAIAQKVETEWRVHESLQHKIGETAVDTEKSTSITTLMSEPIAAYKPSRPSKPIAVVAGGFLGGLVCLGLLGFDLFRGGPFLNRRQLEQALKVPVHGRDPPSQGWLPGRLSGGNEPSAPFHGTPVRHASSTLTSVKQEPEGLRLAACLASASAYYGPHPADLGDPGG